MIDIQKARQNLTRKFEIRRQRSMERFATASHDCDEIIKLIISKYRPSRIYQWGSLLNQDLFNEHSDIDIAVEGITDAEEFFKLLGDVMDISSIPLDIVQIEKIEPEFADGIRQSGKCVYERQ